MSGRHHFYLIIPDMLNRKTHTRLAETDRISLYTLTCNAENDTAKPCTLTGSAETNRECVWTRACNVMSEPNTPKVLIMTVECHSIQVLLGSIHVLIHSFQARHQ